MPKKEIENWEKEINEILITLTDKTGFNHSNESIDAFNLAETGLVELLKSEKEKLLERIKEKSKKLPIEIERTNSDYRQGMHTGIDLCIDIIIADLEKLKEEIKKEL